MTLAPLACPGQPSASGPRWPWIGGRVGARVVERLCGAVCARPEAPLHPPSADAPCIETCIACAADFFVKGQHGAPRRASPPLCCGEPPA